MKEKVKNAVQSLIEEFEVELSGEKYILKPDAIGDQIDLGKQIINEKLSTFIEGARKVGMVATEMAECIDKITSHNITPEEVHNYTFSPAGMRHYMWLILKKAQPDITIEKVSELCSIDNFLNMIKVVRNLSAEDEDDEGEDKTGDTAADKDSKKANGSA